MAIDQALRDLMQDSVTIEPWSGQNVNVEDTYDAAVTYTCRVVGQRKLIRDAQGQQVTSMVQVYLDRLASFDVRSRITLPARFSPTQPPILAVQMTPDEDGTSGSGAYSTVYC